MGPKLLVLLKDVAPRASRVAVIYGASYQAISQPIYAVLNTQAAAGGITLRACPVGTRKDIHALDPVWTREPVDGLIVFFDAFTIGNTGDIVRLAALHRLPAVYASRYFVDAGGLFSYGYQCRRRCCARPRSWPGYSTEPSPQTFRSSGSRSSNYW